MFLNYAPNNFSLKFRYTLIFNTYYFITPKFYPIFALETVFNYIEIMRVKDLLKEKGVTAKELAARLNLSEGALSQSLNGNPTLERLNQIAAALGVSVAELFEAPASGAASITCPHCGKPITLQVEK